MPVASWKSSSSGVKSSQASGEDSFSFSTGMAPSPAFWPSGRHSDSATDRSYGKFGGKERHGRDSRWVEDAVPSLWQAPQPGYQAAAQERTKFKTDADCAVPAAATAGRPIEPPAPRALPAWPRLRLRLRAMPRTIGIAGARVLPISRRRMRVRLLRNGLARATELGGKVLELRQSIAHRQHCFSIVDV